MKRSEITYTAQLWATCAVDVNNEHALGVDKSYY